MRPELRAADVRKVVTVCSPTSPGRPRWERLDPETVRRVMARYFDEMRGAIERHGGTVEKFIGDAVMAVFGVPVVHEDDALRAVRAALEMRDALAALNDELERDRGVRIRLRTGMNTGEVVAGDPAAGQARHRRRGQRRRASRAGGRPGRVLLGEPT